LRNPEERKTGKYNAIKKVSLGLLCFLMLFSGEKVARERSKQRKMKAANEKVCRNSF